MLVSLVRHGDVIGRPHVFRGTADPALSDAGWQQLRARIAWLATPAIARVVASPALRCRAFAEELAREHAVPLAIDDDLRELAFGDWEECTPAEVAERDAATLAAFRADPYSATPPGGEPYRELVSRVRAAVARIAREPVAHVVVVTHAGVMRTLLADWLNIPATHLARIALGPASTCRVSLAEAHRPSSEAHRPSSEAYRPSSEAPIVLSVDSGIPCVA